MCQLNRMKLLTYIIVVSVAAFLITAVDKWFAVAGTRRISERFLFGLSLVGGWPGMICGMLLFRHKTRKAEFYSGIIFISVVEMLIYFAFITRSHEILTTAQ